MQENQQGRIVNKNVSHHIVNGRKTKVESVASEVNMTVQYKLELLKAQLDILLNDFVQIQTVGGGRDFQIGLLLWENMVTC